MPVNPVFAQHPDRDTVPVEQKQKKRWFRKVNDYVDSLKNRRFRDSVLRKISKANEPPKPEDSSMYKSEKYFTEHTGKVIRRIIYRQLKVFGPGSINDTTFTTNMKLIKMANKLHYNSHIWLIRQNLFFRERDTVNAFELAENERYLRSRPFIQDARIYVVNSTDNNDTADVLVITKDVFEYGADVRKVQTSAVGASVYNNNLFGAGQKVEVGFLWDKDYKPEWNSEISYTKYNLWGSFIDASVGYSTLNNTTALDSGVYEGSYYVRVNRPLYRQTASLAGGLTLAHNFSMNIRNRADSLYRDYRYNVFDVWTGYNFRRRRGDDGKMGSKPDMAILGRYYRVNFDKRPNQEIYKNDPIYNDRHYYIGQFYIFKQDFFKAHHFFGFGRTEDIPFGYNASLTAGWENWVGRRRFYTGVEMQKDWLTKMQGIVTLKLGMGTFWQAGVSEDAVIHGEVDYFSRLFKFGKKGYLRQFGRIDYLGNPNNYFYRPLNINRENGLTGYVRTTINGYQRLNVQSETVWYSPLRVYGFKFNFFLSLQASQLNYEKTNLLSNPIYSGFGVGVRIRNENLSINTLQLAAYAYPNAAPGMQGVWFQLTTVSDLRFDIFALKIPQFISFR
ncbi:hypothetical protein LX64_00542 [Chitinophaga skermanii]|uniref:Surface antigen-like variable number repeat protein n=1 Tax=Chitinophaga skermanii TaxID=331697 RepID=A0A327R3Z7_9BACT|nr:hypothetical protein [Chitinophaga skermanii]RAJ10935.1 hypothetical protein LX64_00542 [Chitinophaga skermanii]